MAVKIAKLFKDYSFQKLSQEARLLYIYLISNPSLNTIGVFSPDIRVVALEVGITKDQLRSATRELITTNYVHVKEYEGVIYYIIPKHFDTIPNSDRTALKVSKIISTLPKSFVEFLGKLGIKSEAKLITFIKPTPEEVTQYAMSLGHNVSGKEFVDFYDSKSGTKTYWVDGRNKMVRDWKLKLSKVWCRDENKLTAVPNAPKGFEYFHIVKEDTAHYPDGWRGGKPWSKNFTIDILLKREYESVKKL